jgi:glyoxylase-like metal-dependent hydrolase (beta-lactamase superfamily II)
VLERTLSMSFHGLFGALLISVMALVPAAGTFAAGPERTIEELRDGVYRFTEERHSSVFMVTDEGVVVTDPLNRGAAEWLKGEIARRFDLPVRYVVYSHNHSDHVYGGEVFDGEGVVFVSHRLAQEDLARTKARTRIPDVTFEDEKVIELGGKSVHLRYHGPNDGRGSISMLFQPAKVLFVVDWITLDRMPWQKLWSFDVDGMIESIREVEAMDFDLIAPGHGPVGTKEKIGVIRRYLEALREAVIEAILAGKELEEMQRDIRLDEFRRLAHYEDWLPANIEGMWKELMNESGMSWRP